MRLRDRNYIAYLGALTLLFSYAEMFLPRTVPFFRLGLGNTMASGVVMYGLLFLGQGSFALLGPMMLFSLFASILTAFLALHLHIPEEAPVILNSKNELKTYSPYRIWGKMEKLDALLKIMYVCLIFK